MTDLEMGRLPMQEKNMMDRLPLTNLLAPLPLEAWEKTKDTLHLYCQIVGKTRLNLMPRKNHWWFATLYLTSRGLGTSPIPYGGMVFEMDFDFIDHQFQIRTSEGYGKSFPLENGLSVAKFYKQVGTLLRDIGVEGKILAKPYGLPMTTPFAEDEENHHYDREYIRRYWRILVAVDEIFKEFSGRFNGKTCPVHLYWHSFDLAVTRFSGREAQMAKGSRSDREAYSHEVISAGFWPGDPNVREPTFYSYTYPSPPGLGEQTIQPKAAKWVEVNGSPMALYPYEAMRTAPDSKAALLEFLESTYQAGAKLADWDQEKFKIRSLD